MESFMPFDSDFGGGVVLKPLGNGLHVCLMTWSDAGNSGGGSIASVCFLRESGKTVQVIAPEGNRCAESMKMDLLQGYDLGEAWTEGKDVVISFRAGFNSVERVTDTSSLGKFAALCLEVSAERGYKDYPG